VETLVGDDDPAGQNWSGEPQATPTSLVVPGLGQYRPARHGPSHRLEVTLTEPPKRPVGHSSRSPFWQKDPTGQEATPDRRVAFAPSGVLYMPARG
jgi:hypothetical protein